MEEIESRAILNRNSDEFSASKSNILTIALTALRLDFPKVPHSGKSGSGKYDDLTEISLEEVAEHDHMQDCWIVIYDRVYEVTKFLDSHPGGWDIMLDYAGMDCTIAFRGTGHSDAAIAMLDKYLIGQLPSHQRIFRCTKGGIQFSDMPE